MFQLPEGEIGWDLEDPVTGELQAIVDLAWPEGLQPGLSQPVALLLDEERSGEPLDLRHVGEVLDDRHLVLLRHGSRRLRPVEIPRRPLALVTHPQHAAEIHGPVIASRARPPARRSPRFAPSSTSPYLPRGSRRVCRS